MFGSQFFEQKKQGLAPLSLKQYGADTDSSPPIEDLIMGLKGPFDAVEIEVKNLPLLRTLVAAHGAVRNAEIPKDLLYSDQNFTILDDKNEGYYRDNVAIKIGDVFVRFARTGKGGFSFEIYLIDHKNRELTLIRPAEMSRKFGSFSEEQFKGLFSFDPPFPKCNIGTMTDMNMDRLQRAALNHTMPSEMYLESDSITVNSIFNNQIYKVLKLYMLQAILGDITQIDAFKGHFELLHPTEYEAFPTWENNPGISSSTRTESLYSGYLEFWVILVQLKWELKYDEEFFPLLNASSNHFHAVTPAEKEAFAIELRSLRNGIYDKYQNQTESVKVQDTIPMMRLAADKLIESAEILPIADEERTLYEQVSNLLNQKKALGVTNRF